MTEFPYYLKWFKSTSVLCVSKGIQNIVFVNEESFVIIIVPILFNKLKKIIKFYGIPVVIHSFEEQRYSLYTIQTNGIYMAATYNLEVN